MNAQKILEMAKKFENETVENLSTMIKIPSFSGKEEKVINAIKSMCEEAGFDEVKVDGLGNLVARIGSGKTILAFDAHIDTVGTGDLQQWEFDPFSGAVSEGHVLGRGSVDQEGGAASMITAGKILKSLNIAEDLTIYFTFTVMEEDCDGMCWRYLIEKENIRPDFAVITEPTNLNLYRGHRGRMEIKINFSGVSAHGSMPERGVNAIYKASRVALELEKLNERLKNHPFLGKGSLTVSDFSSSAPSLCAVADGASLHIDRRLTLGESRETVIEELNKIVGDQGSIEIPVYDEKSYTGESFPQDQYFPTWVVEDDHHLVRSGIGTFQSLFDKDPFVDKWIFSTNGVAICGLHGIPAIGFGPGNEIYAHAPNEKVPIDHLVKASAFYAMLPFHLMAV